jgi:hypothetical protein
MYSSTPTPPPHYTPVTIPALTAEVLTDLVQRLVAADPAALARIERGVGILLGGGVAETATVGHYTVRGSDGRHYATASGACNCPDSLTRERTCKHQYAIRLFHAMGDAAAFERAQSRWVLTVAGAQLLRDEGV